jgi:DNA-binding response OmpR family regulator
VKQFVPDSKPIILVLDDDKWSLELYARELASNYEVVTSECIEDAQKHLKNKAIIAIIIEPTVNEDQGWSLLTEIRAFAKPPLVILCSVVDDRKMGLELGADAFVVKPVLPTTLHRLIDQIVTRRTT